MARSEERLPGPWHSACHLLRAETKGTAEAVDTEELGMAGAVGGGHEVISFSFTLTSWFLLSSRSSEHSSGLCKLFQRLLRTGTNISLIIPQAFPNTGKAD